MEITYIGHSCFKIKGKELTIVTDPYDPKKVGYKLPKLDANVVLVSHQHEDHNNVSAVGSVEHVFDGPGEYETKDTYIHAIKTYHDDTEGKERGTNTMFYINLDGFNILFCGDLGHELPKDILDDINSVDVLIVPVGGTYTIDAKVATDVVSLLEPGLVIPMHYQTEDLTTLPKKLDGVDKFLTQMGVKGDIKAEDKLVVKNKTDIPETSRVVLLAPQH